MIYLDHAATTPMRPEAIAALTAALAVVGNPSSIHSAGQQAKRLLEESRERIAATLGADGIEVIFTGNGTEAVNLAIKGLWWRRQAASAGSSQRILVPAGEHHATLDAIEWLAAHEGAVIDEVLLDAAGVAVSTGSACQAGVPEPSHVLMAMGRSESDARGALRITLGHVSTDAEVDAFLAALPGAYAQAAKAGLAARATSFDR